MSTTVIPVLHYLKSCWNIKPDVVSVFEVTKKVFVAVLSFAAKILKEQVDYWNIEHILHMKCHNKCDLHILSVVHKFNI